MSSLLYHKTPFTFQWHHITNLFFSLPFILSLCSCDLFFCCPPLILCLHWRVHKWSDAAFDLQSLCKSRLHIKLNVSGKVSIHYTYHLVALLPLGAMCAYSFFTLGHGGNQTTNHASVTVTLYQLSHTGSFLLAWDYSKIFSSTGLSANTNSSTALLVHKK